MSALKTSQPSPSSNPNENGTDFQIIERIPHKMNQNGVLSISQIKSPYEIIEEVPQVFLTMEQMNSDPLKLMCQLEAKYSEYGAVKLTVCDEWKYTFCFPHVDCPTRMRKQSLQDLTLGKVSFFTASLGKSLSILILTQPFEQTEKCIKFSDYKVQALEFSQNYKYITSPTGSTSQAVIQNEYWNLVTNKKYSKNELNITYAADLQSSIYGSGFPTATLQKQDEDENFNYSKNGWNLNNMFMSPYSLLRILEERDIQISGISQPWIYMGMRFSSFCWHVQDLFLNSVNYNHEGQTKTWYVVPGQYKELFDNYVQDNCQNKKNKFLLEHITLLIDPLELIKAGIKVYKIHQRAKDYVLTFFKAYHAGFSHGYNVCEAANFISFESIDSIKQAFRHYEQQELLYKRKMKAQVLSFDWVIYQNIVKDLPVPSQYTNKVLKEYHKILNRETILIKNSISRYGPFHNVNIISQKKSYCSNKCTYCKNYIYLSSIKCLDCKQNLCEWHISKCQCAPKKWTLVIRELNSERQNLVDIVPMLKCKSND